LHAYGKAVVSYVVYTIVIGSAISTFHVSPWQTCSMDTISTNVRTRSHDATTRWLFVHE